MTSVVILTSSGEELSWVLLDQAAPRAGEMGRAA
jgi:hypothetical protein